MVDIFWQKTYGQTLVSESGYDDIRDFFKALINNDIISWSPNDDIPVLRLSNTQKNMLANQLRQTSNVESSPVSRVFEEANIPTQQLPPDLSDGSFIDVYVQNIFSPSKFYVNIRSNECSGALDLLAIEMK